MRVYLSGPLFTTGERMFNSALAARLRAAGHEVLLPQEQEVDSADPERTFRGDVAALQASDVVVGITDGPDPDSGTAWEIGFAYAFRRPIVLLRTDSRVAIDAGAPYNLMLAQSATERIELACPTVDEAAHAVIRALECLPVPTQRP